MGWRSQRNVSTPSPKVSIRESHIKSSSLHGIIKATHRCHGDGINQPKQHATTLCSTKTSQEPTTATCFQNSTMHGQHRMDRSNCLRLFFSAELGLFSTRTAWERFQVGYHEPQSRTTTNHKTTPLCQRLRGKHSSFGARCTNGLDDVEKSYR